MTSCDHSIKNISDPSTESTEQQQTQHHHKSPENHKAKKPKMSTCEDIEHKEAKSCNGIKKIGTHNGTFHCDEVFACYMLTQLDQFKDATIIRTRDPKKLDECDIVVDVGGVYDPTKWRFDHHQKSFNETLSSILPGKKWKTRLSSAGLIYAHFGLDVISNIVNKLNDIKNNNVNKDFIDCSTDGDKDITNVDTVDDMKEVSNSSVNIDEIKCFYDINNKSCGNDGGDVCTKFNIFYDLLYEGFVQAIDAIDNGIDIADGPLRYMINTDISTRVSYLNTSWCDPDGQDENVIKKQFDRAMSLVGAEFEERIRYYEKVWWPARLIVQEALIRRFNIHPSGEIMMLSEGSCPWKDHLRLLEEEEEQEKEVKYVLYPDTNGSWRIQCVPLAKNSFENRLSLPKSWRGLRDEELSKITNIDGCVFVHVTGFIGGNKNKDGVLKMAVKALEEARKD